MPHLAPWDNPDRFNAFRHWVDDNGVRGGRGILIYANSGGWFNIYLRDATGKDVDGFSGHIGSKAKARSHADGLARRHRWDLAR